MFESIVDKIKIALGFRCPFWKECPYFQPSCHDNWDWCGEFRERNRKGNWIVGLEFGKGRANIALAYIIIELKKEFPKAKLIVQNGIDAWLSLFEFRKEKKLFERKTIYEKGKRLTTEDVLKEVKRIIIEEIGGAEKLPEEKVILVAHPHHLGRCMSIAKDLGINAIKWTDIMRLKVPYDSDDPQWWVRNPVIFFFWNLAGLIWWKIKRLKPKKKYKLKAETGYLKKSEQKTIFKAKI